jgi:subtilisin family serine protease
MIKWKATLAVFTTALMLPLLSQVALAEDTPNDPFFGSKGSWGQPHDDQWALKRVGFTGGSDSAWDLVSVNAKPVIVAVIDSGLDWNHKDFSWENLWRNPGEVPDNGQDDDGNGYVDDIVGWNFLGHNNSPWDHDGHGTFVAGLIGATRGNGTGIAGINPNVKVMVLKAINNFGHTRASYIAKALVYAADNGARVANLSAGGADLTEIEKAAIDYAVSRGVLIVVAAGNQGKDLSDFGPAGSDKVITVAATGTDDKHTVFSNWGTPVDIAAPGEDMLSLRARRTDTISGVPGLEYESESAFVGSDRRYYRASGTSFSAPLITGIASLLLSNNPSLTAAQVRRMLLQSARDIDAPGRDQFSGYGLVDARAALKADPEFYLATEILGVEIGSVDGKPALKVFGTVQSNGLYGRWLEIGVGDEPAAWKKVTPASKDTIDRDLLGTIPASEFAGEAVWMIKVRTRHQNGTEREHRYRLKLG